MRLLAAVLLATKALAGTEAVYDTEVFHGAEVSRSSLIVRAEGPRVRFEFSGGSFLVFVVDGQTRVARWSVPAKPGCFLLPVEQLPELQVKALERFREDIRTAPDLTSADRQSLLEKVKTSIDDVRRAPKERTQTFTHLSAEPGRFPCESYAVTEGGEDVGTVCLQLKSKPPARFTARAGPGEWWMSFPAHLEARQLPVSMEGRRGGRVLHRATLRSVETRAIAPGEFLTDQVCRSGLEM